MRQLAEGGVELIRFIKETARLIDSIAARCIACATSRASTAMLNAFDDLLR